MMSGGFEMEQVQLDFLKELIETPSPSGDEVAIQKKWMAYIKGHVEKIETDYSGSAIGILNSEAPFKVMLAGHCDEISFMVTHIDDKGFVYVTKSGGINPKVALGMRVRILNENGVVDGVVGIKAEHQGGAKSEIKVSDIYIDCGASSKEELDGKVSVGDHVLYDVGAKVMTNDRLIGRALDNRTGAFIVAEVLRRLSGESLNVGVYGVSTVNEETTMGGAHFAACHIKPSLGIACDVTFASDYPGLDPKEYGDVKLGGGPVLAKGSQINKKINGLLKKAADNADIGIQYEVTPRTTGTDADRIRFSGDGVPVALVSLPLRYMHSPSEVVSIKDMDAEIDLLVEFIKSLKGDENLKPLE